MCNNMNIPLMTHFIRDSSPEQSMLCNAIRRSVGVSTHDDEDCSTEINHMYCVYILVCAHLHTCVCTYTCVHM